MASREHYERGDWVLLPGSKVPWRVISVNTGPGGHQTAALKSKGGAWRFDRPMGDVKRTEKPT